MFITGFSISGITRLYQMYIRKGGPLVRVIVFHDVIRAEWFLELLTHLKNTYHVLTPLEFGAKKFHTTKINVLVTFDDGYESWVSKCLPWLTRLDIKALFFINSELVDLYEDEESRTAYVQKNLLLETTKKTISWDGIREIYQRGHTIGGHTKTHRRLSELQGEEQYREISEDKKDIELKLNTELSFFAYPFGNKGDFTLEAKTWAERAGYKFIFSTEAGFMQLNSSLSIPRICIEDGCTKETLTLWIEGGYDIYSKLKQLCVR